MALAFVAATSAYGTTFDITPNAGNLLVVGYFCYGATLANISLSDDQGNTYTVIDRVENAGEPQCVMWYAKNIATGAGHTVTIANGGTGWLCVIEISGADTTAPFTTGEKASNTGSAAQFDSGSVTNSVADSIFVCLWSDSDYNSGATFGIEAGWTLNANADARDTSGTYDIGGMGYKIVSVSAAEVCTWGVANGNDAAINACFKILAAGAAAADNLMLMGVGG